MPDTDMTVVQTTLTYAAHYTQQERSGSGQIF